ncbi:unnamed protein product [Ilex paraguariensis]|uniref:NPH3 domain-containing protein n=1 Tax=Ilex paraguariensis TaxID=185542 RepID=A0ABC8UMG6_9AQUA
MKCHLTFGWKENNRNEDEVYETWDKARHLLHRRGYQFALLPKCGLLQRLCSDSGDSSDVTLELHDIPGGEDAFELCAKFCYGITINLSAHNFVSAICAAKFLRMTEAVDKGNFIMKLEAFFTSCILEGWKDSIVILQTTGRLPEWSENLGIIRRCIDSIVEKILTPPAQVSWSYTYTRRGYDKKRHPSVPKDWWTEDVSGLNIDLFRCIVTAVRSTNMLPPQLIGEALHVYACRWLPDTTKIKPPENSASHIEESTEEKRKDLETIVSMIPADQGSVSIGFLLRLLSIANLLGVSPVTKTELIRRSGLQFEDATLNDLLIPSHNAQDPHFYDIDLVGAVLESFLMQWRRQSNGEQSQSVRSIKLVGKLIDSYLQVVAKDVNMAVHKVVSLAETLPEIARTEHDDLYKAINVYLKEHPDLTKAERKHLCHVLDCQKLSPAVCAHVVRNERLPLRTVVQVLFFEQEKGAHKLPPQPQEQFPTRKQTKISRNEVSKVKLGPHEQSSTAEGTRRSSIHGISGRDHQRVGKSGGKLQVESEQRLDRKEIAETLAGKEKEIREEGISGSKLDPKKLIQRRSRSDHKHSKSTER